MFPGSDRSLPGSGQQPGEGRCWKVSPCFCCRTDVLLVVTDWLWVWVWFWSCHVPVGSSLSSLHCNPSLTSAVAALRSEHGAGGEGWMRTWSKCFWKTEHTRCFNIINNSVKHKIKISAFLPCMEENSGHFWKVCGRKNEMVFKHRMFFWPAVLCSQVSFALLGLHNNSLFSPTSCRIQAKVPGMKRKTE